MSHEINVIADPKQIVAVLGGMFPFSPTWLEESAKKTIKTLALGNKIENIPTFYFEDELLVGKLGFSEESDDRKKVIMYSRELPRYTPDGENNDGETDIMEIARRPSIIEGDSIAVLADYLEGGPYQESLSVAHYKNPDILSARSRFSFDRRLVLDEGIEETLQISVGVNNDYVEDFAAYLQQLKTPESVYFAEEFAKREKKPLAEDIVSSELNEYMSPHPRNTADADYSDRIANLAVHIINF